MEIKGEPMRRASAVDAPAIWGPLNTRLRTLRRERQLIEKAIEALTRISHARLSRARRRARL
jgi:hypothetical protein